MATKAEELRILAQEIKNETQVGANTAERVGTAFEQAANGLDELLQNVGAIDISELNATEDTHTLATYEDLASALNALPISYRKGGMMIKFVQTSDNKYVQWRNMNQNWSTAVSDWQGVDEEPTENSKNLVSSEGVCYSVREIKGSKTTMTIPSNEMIGIPIYNVKQGDAIKIKIDSYAGSAAVKILGIIEFPQTYDMLVNGGISEGDVVSLNLTRDYKAIQVYKQNDVTNELIFTTQFKGVTGVLFDNAIYERNVYTTTSTLVTTFTNIKQGESFKIFINSYKGNANIKVQGYNTDQDYDFLSDGELEEGKYIILTLTKSYNSLRLYKPGDSINSWTFSVEKIGLIQDEIEREIKPIYDECLDKTDTITSTVQDNFIYGSQKGDLYEILINSYSGTSSLFVFGFYSENEYDTFTNNLSVGESILIPINKDYLYLKIYKRENTESLTYTVHKFSKINGDITRNKININSNTVDIQNLKAERKHTPFPYSAKIFMQVACVGDSYTAGYQKTEGSVVKTNENYAWPHYISNITGHKWLNFGVSGSSCKSWVDEKPNYNKMAELRAKKCQAYVIGLMINDSTPSSAQYVPLGTVNDIGQTPGEGAGETNSYYAYYYALIQEILSINNKAIVFCNTLPKSLTDYNGYNQAVRDIVAYCRNNNQNVWLCDLKANYYNEDYFLNSIFLSDGVDGHYTGIGYEFMAEGMVKVISDVINANIPSFQEVEAIPYDE